MPRPDVILRNKSRQQRDAVANSWLDTDVSTERRQKISAALKGKPFCKRQPHTEETRLKIGKAHIGVPKEKLQGSKHPQWKGGKPLCATCGKLLSRYKAKLCGNCSTEYKRSRAGQPTGLVHTAETKNIIRAKTIIHLQQNHLKCNTKIEIKMATLLNELGIKFVAQYNFNDKFLCDFAIPSAKIIVECDGDYWHNREDVKKHDKAKNVYIKKCGWTIMRFWEHEIHDSIDKIKNIFSVVLEFALP